MFCISFILHIAIYGAFHVLRQVGYPRYWCRFDGESSGLSSCRSRLLILLMKLEHAYQFTGIYARRLLHF